MESTKEIKIEIFDIQNDFKKHLEIENNKRILFSGPFGTGKSTFLKEVAESEDEDSFFYLRIFPVNYSVSSNEDVFELIKFDLLFQLMGRFYEEIKLEKEDFTLLLKSQMFIMERMNFMPLLYAILSFSEKIGTPIVDFIKALENTVGDFKKFNEEIKIDEENDISAFLKSIENKKGNQHEMDAISELIFDLIERVKKENKKLAVLIIDDLDRLDPDHVFRIFNIFSAHHEEINNRNKFGFDKVIFVCDIENIRKIFHHKYGLDVDFSGYIDKFYSISPFDFDNRKYVKNKIESFLFKIEFDRNLSFYSMDKNNRFLVVLKSITLSLIDAKLLNLRMLLSSPSLKVPELVYGKYNTYLSSSPILVLFYLLKNFYGSFEILQIKLSSLFELFDSGNFRSRHGDGYVTKNEFDVNNLISYCLLFLSPEDLNVDISKEEKTVYLENYDCTFHYNEFNSYDYVSFVNFKKATKGQNMDSQDVVLNPYRILFDTFIICKKRGLLQ
ncbi:P-loop NTPase fold protein [Flavobacterium nitrogenifigens]|uniref:KAP family P-loop domain-containing protein n=1 Tax=Flavobacterium nitrogenifigens TaxID=1617283 RepID=A0A521DRP0_9FLAO|nr:P-loop NTPase fold protein [Flavobacterium nitrogenifigens]KAF2327495.1 hypothetical protein DM397_18890 [Flavobacterium nitrogenifigens]SMO74423.1 KAP family P-loop domain-containing protein [Flavobacterium nitrogenifigens]